MMHELSPRQRLQALPKAERDAFLDSLSEAEAATMFYDWQGFNARPNQRFPEGDWSEWWILSGRGYGKTRIGAEWVRSIATGSTPLAKGKAARIAIVAETAADARDVLVEGESGILKTHPDDFRPTYEPSKRRLTWPNGATAFLYNGTEPDQLRGPNNDAAWTDELAKWRYALETYDQLQFTLRAGKNPQQIHTTTPRPIRIIRDAVKAAQRDSTIRITRGSTLENAANLAPAFVERIQQRYAGTRLGRQELEGHILDGVPGALWTLDLIDAGRINDAPDDLVRIVVAIDPAVSSQETSDEPGTHGIVVCGIDAGGHGYVLEDASTQGRPEEWAARAVQAYRHWEADCIVAEVNQGGDMVESVMRSQAPTLPVKTVRASRGKHVRAEPISALYAQSRVSHVGSWVELEDQLCEMTDGGYTGEGSPDRADAMVWAFSELFPKMTKKIKPASSYKQRLVEHSAGGWMAA